MFVDLGRIIGGPDEGDGLMGALLLGPLAGTFVAAGIAGHGTFDAAGGGAGVAEAFTGSAFHAEGVAAGFGRAAASGEGFAAHFFRHMHLTDWYVLDDWLGTGVFNGAKALAKEVKEVALAHGFILRQLTEHKTQKGVGELLEQYQALGTKLPDGDLLKQVYRKLSAILHPDRNPGNHEMAGLLNGARDLLGKPEIRGQYERALQTHYSDIERIIKEVVGAPVATQAAAARAVKGFLTGPAESIVPLESAAKASWFSQMSKGQKIGLAFAGAAAVGLGAYYVYRSLNTRSHQHPHEQATLGHNPGHHSHAATIRKENTTHTHTQAM